MEEMKNVVFKWNKVCVLIIPGMISALVFPRLVFAQARAVGARTPPPGTEAEEATAEKGIKVGYVDVQKIFDSCPSVQKATLNLKKEIEMKQGSIAKGEGEIIKLQNELKDKEVVLSEAEKKKRQKEIEDKITSLRKKAESDRLALMAREKRLTQSIINSIRDILTGIAKKEKISLVLEKDSVLYSTEAVDLTEKVIEELGSVAISE